MYSLTYVVEVTAPTTSFPSTIWPWATLTNPSDRNQTIAIGFHLTKDVIVQNPAEIVNMTANFASPDGWDMTNAVANVLITMDPKTTGVSSYVAPPASMMLVANQSVTSTVSPFTTLTNPSLTLNASTASATKVLPSDSSVVPSGHTTGQLIGVAVGCLLGGLLFAALLASLLFRRYRKSYRENKNSNQSLSSKESRNESTTNEFGGTTAWQKTLPQPDSDNAIMRLATRSLDEIELLVEEFYSSQPLLGERAIKATELSMLNSPHLPETLADQLRKAQNPTTCIKHCISYYMIRTIEFSTDFSRSLLPKDYQIPEIQKSALLNEQRSTRLAASQLRVLTAHLRPDPQKDETYMALRAGIIAEATQQIELALQPWARGDTNARHKALKGVMIHISELGIKLFSQPACFGWAWDLSKSSLAPVSAGRDGTTFVMLPGLDKTVDHCGEVLRPALCIVEPRLGAVS